MNRVEVLLQTAAVRLSVFDHPPGAAHADPPEEAAARDAVHFAEAGTFAVRPAGLGASRGRATWVFSPGMLFVTPRALAFACRHDAEQPADRCFSVAYAPEAVEDLRTAGLPAFRATAAPATARQHFLRDRLRAGAALGGLADGLRAEVLAGALFAALGDGEVAAGADGRGPPPGGSAVARRVARAADLIEAEYARPLALAELARAAGMSPYHFARAFRRLTGLPPHRYLTAVRLRAAAHRIEQGARVTDACYAAGFASPSHFATTFRRRFGVAPSGLVRGPHRPVLLAALATPVWGGRPRRADA